MHIVSCPRCGEVMRRSRRRLVESMVFAGAFRCEACRLRVRFSRLFMLKAKRYVSCPRCRSFDLTVLARRDHIDRFSKNPLRRVLGFLSARLYYCRACRFQFHDPRRRAPMHERKRKRGSTAAGVRGRMGLAS